MTAVTASNSPKSSTESNRGWGFGQGCVHKCASAIVSTHGDRVQRKLPRWNQLPLVTRLNLYLSHWAENKFPRLWQGILPQYPVPRLWGDEWEQLSASSWGRRVRKRKQPIWGSEGSVFLPAGLTGKSTMRFFTKKIVNLEGKEWWLDYLTS